MIKLNENYNEAFDNFRNRYELNHLSLDEIDEIVQNLLGKKGLGFSSNLNNTIIELIQPFKRFLRGVDNYIDFEDKRFIDNEYLLDQDQDLQNKITEIFRQLKRSGVISIRRKKFDSNIPTSIKVFLSLLYPCEYSLVDDLIDFLFQSLHLDETIDNNYSRLTKIQTIEGYYSQDLYKVLLYFSCFMKVEIDLVDYVYDYRFSSSTLNNNSLSIQFKKDANTPDLLKWFSWKDYLEYMNEHDKAITFKKRLYPLKYIKTYNQFSYFITFKELLSIKYKESIEIQNRTNTLYKKLILDSLYIYRFNYGCANHESRVVYVKVKTKDKNKVYPIDFKAFYCLECCRYYTYVHLHEMLDQNVTNLLIQTHYSEEGNIDYQDLNESTFKSNGYNVDSRYNLSTYVRRKVLDLIIENKLCSPQQVISFLNTQISSKENHTYDYSNAIRKWKEDMDYIYRKHL